MPHSTVPTAFIMGLLAIGSTVGGSTITLPAVADAMLSSANPASNYGANDRHAVSAPLAQGEFQTLIKFDTAPAKAQFDAAFGPGRWRFSAGYAYGNAAKDHAIYNALVPSTLYLVDWLPDDAWEEGTGTVAAPGATGVNYNSLATLTAGFETIGSSTNGNGIPGEGGFSSLSPQGLDPGWDADILSGGLVTLRLRYYAVSAPPFATTTGSAISVSREAPGPQPGLRLTATLIPEPSAAALLLLPAALAGLRRRRRRSR